MRAWLCKRLGHPMIERKVLWHTRRIHLYRIACRCGHRHELRRRFK